MTAAIIDIHEFYNELKGAGFSEQQADIIAKIQGKTATATIEQIKSEGLATKSDIETVRREIAEAKSDIIKTTVTIVGAFALIQTTIIAGLMLKLTGTF